MCFCVILVCKRNSGDENNISVIAIRIGFDNSITIPFTTSWNHVDKLEHSY